MNSGLKSAAKRINIHSKVPIHSTEKSKLSGFADSRCVLLTFTGDLMSAAAIRYLVFDVKSFTDIPLAAQFLNSAKTRNKQTRGDAVGKWKEQPTVETEKDFISYSFQIPTCVALAKVSENFELLDVAAISEVALRPPEITERFWRGWERYGRPAFVAFNGRSFNIPLMELAAFRYGISIPGWFSPLARNYDQPRSRFNQSSQIDLQDLFTDFGATSFFGGLNLAAKLVGKSGKTSVSQNMIDEMRQAGKFQEIEDYCRCDVLDAYFVFLRTRVLTGYLTLAEELKYVEKTKNWLKERAETNAGYRLYLENWRDWENPWNHSSVGNADTVPKEKNADGSSQTTSREKK